MYALRLLAIEKFGVFLDQSFFSVAGMDSGSQPPLVIWIGYLFTIVFGHHEWVLKMVSFIFGILSLIVLYKTGLELFDRKSAILSVIIFSSNLVFSIYIKRFQLDIPVTFFIITSFLFFIKYYKNPETKYLIYSGVCLGLSLITKALVGVLIPVVISAFFVFMYFKDGNKFDKKIFIKSVIVILLTSLIISLPWHIYMYITHGNSFTDYLFGFHIFQRAFEGVDDNIKPSGVFYYIKFLLTIFPYSVLIFYFLYVDLKQLKKIHFSRILLWVWFLIVLIVVSLFKTKLESYSLLFLPAFSLLLSYFIVNHEPSQREKPVIIILVLLNLVWFFMDEFRNKFINEIRYLFENNLATLTIYFVIFVAVLAALYFLINKLYRYRDVRNDLKYLLVIIFVVNNVYSLINPPLFESSFKLSDIKEYINKSGVKNFTYVSPQYKYNPQLSYYFEGVDLGWQGDYNWKLIELKNDISNTKQEILNTRNKFIIVEKDNINRGEYIESEKFIPENYKLIIKHHGYELWELLY